MDAETHVVGELIRRTGRLEREIRRWRLCAFAAGLCVAACTATNWSGSGGGRVLHVRGLVVEDAEGRPRIVLGAPTPAVAGRKRADATVSLLFLDGDGDERVALGYQPDPMIGGRVVPRVSQAVGLNVYDGDGNERGGFSFLESGAVVLGLDTANGREGIAASVDDVQGHAALMMASAAGGYERLGLFVDDERALLKVADTSGAERVILTAGATEDARLLVLDAEHTTRRDLISGAHR